MMDSGQIRKIFESSVLVKQQVLADASLLDRVRQVAEAIVHCYRKGGKVLFCGNGGSAADAQHLAAELSGRFYSDRDPLDAEALHVNTSYLTAVGNDYGYDQVFSRLVKARGRSGDVLIALSTSGNSANVIRALEEARRLGLLTVGMTGATGGRMASLCDILLNVPSTDTPRIQEVHMLMGHIICQLVEAELFAAGR
ncbi:MAG: D-sedoheptulose 7-phosphate isomerase [Chitinophagales bacterium]|nr:D-sedoheptulose 7-phosphate isomerase [Chitinophagales bacterium]